FFFFFFSSRRRHTRSDRDWSSDVCSSDLEYVYFSSDSYHQVYPFKISFRSNHPQLPIHLAVTKMYCSEVYQDSVFGSYFVDQSFLIHIFVEKISFVIPYIRTQKIPDPRLHKQIVDKIPKWHFLLTQSFFSPYHSG